MRKTKLGKTLLDDVVALEKQFGLMRADLFLAQAAKRGGDLKETERLMQVVLLQRFPRIDDIWQAAMEWWKLEVFKRQWAAGYCFACQGDGKMVGGTGDPKHPVKMVACTECHGKGRVAPRKPTGEMIPAGQEPVRKKKRRAVV